MELQNESLSDFSQVDGMADTVTHTRFSLTKRWMQPKILQKSIWTGGRIANAALACESLLELFWALSKDLLPVRKRPHARLFCTSDTCG